MAREARTLPVPRRPGKDAIRQLLASGLQTTEKNTMSRTVRVMTLFSLRVTIIRGSYKVARGLESQGLKVEGGFVRGS